MDEMEYLQEFERLETERALAEVRLKVLKQRWKLGIRAESTSESPKIEAALENDLRSQVAEIPASKGCKVLIGDRDMSLLEFFDMGECTPDEAMDFLGYHEPLNAPPTRRKNHRQKLINDMTAGQYVAGKSNNPGPRGKKTFCTADLVERRLELNGKTEPDQDWNLDVDRQL